MEKKKKSLVVYFSHTRENYSVGSITVGNTAKVAAEIARQTGAETWEIKEVDAYPAAYDECVARAKKEKQSAARPAYQGTAPDLSEYDVVYLGYPNWWNDAPMVVYTFLDSASVDGKRILPFCTHEGSGLGSTARNLAKAYPNANVEQNGMALRGATAQNDANAVAETVAKQLKAWGIDK